MRVHRSLNLWQRGILLAFGLVAITGLGFWLTRDKPVIFTETTTGLSFLHSPKLIQSEISEQDRQSGILARFENSEKEPAALLITVRQEKGLTVAANVTGQSTIDVVMDSAARAFPNRFPGYTEHNRQTMGLNGITSGEVEFSYDGPSGERAMQRFLALIKNDDEAVYLSFQAKKSDFEQLNLRYFTLIAESAVFN